MFDYCPLVNGPCLESKCKFFVQVIGHNPNTGEHVNQWNCAVAFIPALLIENSQMQRQTGAAVESFRNEMVEANDRSMVAFTTQMRVISNGKSSNRS